MVAGLALILLAPDDLEFRGELEQNIAVSGPFEGVLFHHPLDQMPQLLVSFRGLPAHLF